MGTPKPMKILGRGFSLNYADLFLSATIRVYPRPIYRIEAH